MAQQVKLLTVKPGSDLSVTSRTLMVEEENWTLPVCALQHMPLSSPKHMYARNEFFSLLKIKMNKCILERSSNVQTSCISAHYSSIDFLLHFHLGLWILQTQCLFMSIRHVFLNVLDTGILRSESCTVRFMVQDIFSDCRQLSNLQEAEKRKNSCSFPTLLAGH